MGWASKGLFARNGEINFTILKASQRNGPLDRGIPDTPRKKEISERFLDSSELEQCSWGCWLGGIWGTIHEIVMVFGLSQALGEFKSPVVRVGRISRKADLRK